MSVCCPGFWTLLSTQDEPVACGGDFICLVLLHNYHGDGMNLEMPRRFFFCFVFLTAILVTLILPCGDAYGVVN